MSHTRIGGSGRARMRASSVCTYRPSIWASGTSLIEIDGPSEISASASERATRRTGAWAKPVPTTLGSPPGKAQMDAGKRRIVEQREPVAVMDPFELHLAEALTRKMGERHDLAGLGA